LPKSFLRDNKFALLDDLDKDVPF